MSDRIQVSAADFARNFGYWQEQALSRPVSITRHGRERLVICSSERFASQHNAAADAAAAMLDALLANMGVGFVAYDKDWRVARVNPIAEAYFGVAGTSLMGRHATEIVEGVAGSYLFKEFNRVARTRQSAVFEAESIAFPGRFLEFNVFPFLEGVAATWINRTEERHLRDASARDSAFVASVEAHPLIAHAALNAQGRFMSVCETFTQWTGFTMAHLENASAANIVAPKDRARLLSAFTKAMEGRGPQSLAADIQTRTGEDRRLELALSAASLRYAEPFVCITAVEAKSAPGGRARGAKERGG